MWRCGWNLFKLWRLISSWKLILEIVSQEKLKILWPHEISSKAQIIRKRNKNISVNFSEEEFFLIFKNIVFNIKKADRKISIKERFSIKLSSLDKCKIIFEPSVV